MRIRRLNIQSFGALTGCHLDLSGNKMVLIYGDNEAGKSTIAEFMRSTMFPGKNAKYPVAKKSDSGTLELIMDDGGTRILQRDQRKVTEKEGKMLPSAEVRLDSATYRSLFGLDLEELGNDKVITTGDLKKRFLTVKGGEKVPSISNAIRTEMDNMMTRSRVTGNKIIGKYRNMVRDIDTEINLKVSDLEKYDALAANLESLREQLAHAHDAQDAASYTRSKEIMLGFLREKEAIRDELLAERAALEYAQELTDDDFAKYEQLKHRVDSLKLLLDERKDDEQTSMPMMDSVRAERIMTMEDEIQNVWGLKSRYDVLDYALKDLDTAIELDTEYIQEACSSLGVTMDQVRSIESDPLIHEILINPKKKRTVSHKVVKLLSRWKRVAYTFVAVAGVGLGIALDVPLLSALSMAAGIAVNVAPAIIDSYFHVDNIDWATWIPERGFPEGVTKAEAAAMLLDVDRIYDRMCRLDRSVSRKGTFEEEKAAITDSVRDVLRALDLDTGNLGGDMTEMYSQYTMAREAVARYSDAKGLVDKRSEVEVELESLLERFGGEERLLQMNRDRMKLADVDSNLATVEKTINISSKNISLLESKEGDESVTNLDEQEAEIRERVDEINQAIGHVEAEMAALRDDREVNDLRYQRSIWNQRYEDATKRWAILSLADTIINDCCDNLYAPMEPTVVKTANRYLHLMTGGRYQIVPDPRSSDLIIEDRTGRKLISEWSASLGDQVLLSVKMAIAKELTKESVPFIMDDVLVRFDRERKQGACRAILEFAKDQQVIMFTCDRYLENVFKLEGDIRFIQL